MTGIKATKAIIKPAKLPILSASLNPDAAPKAMAHSVVYYLSQDRCMQLMRVFSST